MTNRRPVHTKTTQFLPADFENGSDKTCKEQTRHLTLPHMHGDQRALFLDNRPFSYSENERGSNDISLQFVEVSNVHNCDRSSNATLSNLVYKTV